MAEEGNSDLIVGIQDQVAYITFNRPTKGIF